MWRQRVSWRETVSGISGIISSKAKMRVAAVEQVQSVYRSGLLARSSSRTYRFETLKVTLPQHSLTKRCQPLQWLEKAAKTILNEAAITFQSIWKLSRYYLENTARRIEHTSSDGGKNLSETAEDVQTFEIHTFCFTFAYHIRHSLLACNRWAEFRTTWF